MSSFLCLVLDCMLCHFLLKAVVCSHHPIFRTNKESSIWRQNVHRDVMHLSRRVSDENRACSISICFFKIMDPCVAKSFSMCSHEPIFGTNKNRILKNGLCERTLIQGLFLIRMIKTIFQYFLISMHATFTSGTDSRELSPSSRYLGYLKFLIYDILSHT